MYRLYRVRFSDPRGEQENRGEGIALPLQGIGAQSLTEKLELITIDNNCIGTLPLSR